MNEPQKKILIAITIFLITAISRLIFFEQHFGGFSFDSGSFALAAKDYNIAEWRPHLPGYYLYVQTIRLLMLVTSNSHTAMKLIIILFSSIAMGLFYLILRNWFDNLFSILLVGVALTNPLVWFYGCVTEIYAFDLFFSIALVGLCYSSRSIYFSPFFVGFFSGFRPSSAVLLFPLYAFLWYRHMKISRASVKRIVIAHVLSMFGLLIWLIPMIKTVDGLSEYLSLYQTHNPVQEISMLQNWYRLSSYTAFILFPFLILGIFWILEVFWRRRKQISIEERIPKDFRPTLLWWLIPPLLFFVLFHYSKGYYLLIAVPIISLTILIFRNVVFSKRWILAACVGIQILFFIAMPYSEPSVQTYLSRETRQMNLAQVWWERTTSVFLMAQSQIQALDKTGVEFENALSLLESEGDRKEFIFLDPTFPISGRAMQAKYPELRFTKFSYGEMDHFQLYSGLSKQDQSGSKDMPEDAVIASRTDFVNQYLDDVEKQILYSSGITYFTLPQGDEVVASRYERLFSREAR